MLTGALKKGQLSCEKGFCKSRVAIGLYILQPPPKQKENTKQLDPANSLLRKNSRRHNQDFEKMPDIRERGSTLLSKDLVRRHGGQVAAKIIIYGNYGDGGLDIVPVTGL